MLHVSHKKSQITKEDVSSVSKAVNSCKIAFVNDKEPKEVSKNSRGKSKKNKTVNINFSIFDKNYMLFIG